MEKLEHMRFDDSQNDLVIDMTPDFHVAHNFHPGISTDQVVRYLRWMADKLERGAVKPLEPKHTSLIGE